MPPPCTLLNPISSKPVANLAKSARAKVKNKNLSLFSIPAIQEVETAAQQESHCILAICSFSSLVCIFVCFTLTSKPFFILMFVSHPANQDGAVNLQLDKRWETARAKNMVLCCYCNKRFKVLGNVDAHNFLEYFRMHGRDNQLLTTQWRCYGCL